MIIAIDGPAASGKGTLARRVADAMNYAYLDTGLLYRATGAKVLAENADPSDEAVAVHAAENLSANDLGGEELRSEEVGTAASKVAAIPKVREVLLDFQRSLATTRQRVVAALFWMVAILERSFVRRPRSSFI